MSSDVKRISMWSGPRNVSTALMYAFHHRGDCQVVDEPFYAHYLQHTGIDHPGREETLGSQSTDADEVIQELLHAEVNAEFLFMKNMPHHMVAVDLDFVQEFQNFFLIREPRAMIASYIKKIPEVKMSDFGLDKQFAMYSRLADTGTPPPVIDSHELLKNPERVLSKLCTALDIPFTKAMLHWPAGPIPADGAWAKYWYHNVHASTGLSAPKAKAEVNIPLHLEALVAECEHYYREMKKQEIKA